MRKIVALLLLASVSFSPFASVVTAQTRAAAAPAQTERIDLETYWKIRREGLERSQAMRTLHYLTDLYGPRLTGSPNYKAAADWTVKLMSDWGFKNAHLEPWDFGHPGWLNERLSAHIVSPVKDALVCEALAWTPSTNGTVTGRAYQLVLPERQTKESLTAFLEGVREQLRGRIVLVGRHQSVPVTFNPLNKRREDQEVRNQYDPNNPTPAVPPFAAPSPSPSPSPANPAAQPTPRPPAILTAAQANEQLDQFLVASGVLVRINDAGREHGQIRAFNNRTFDVSKTVPTVVMRNEDYGRISRILADGTPVELEFNIVNRSYPEGRTSYNVIGEIPGTDKADEVVMLGGHLDSWHAATGATDNAVGCAIMLEAARILHTLGLRPRRTIRVALWSGEEQGLLGSKAYVKEHFGTFENPKPEYFKFNGYFNVDSGTGRIRGASVFGPPEAATALRQALAPLEDLGVLGAIATTSRRTGGSDHTSFNEAGLPGIGLGQDPIEYGTHTWHTNLDTYERIVEADVRSAAVVVAAAVYHLATRDEMLPRFTKERMPAPPPAPTPSPSPSPMPTPR
ncbi:MAG TPA: M20/M25/M40 family metallo-hydrolase [Pyrinomonadaceae bacterium]|nr:M20/M25/M40 family metallo-hydrolase [Pyrinomonadaceae bacterium]